MMFGIWYGLASLFLLFKALGVSGLANVSCWWVLLPILYPSMMDIYNRFASKRIGR